MEWEWFGEKIGLRSGFLVGISFFYQLEMTVQGKIRIKVSSAYNGMLAIQKGTNFIMLIWWDENILDWLVSLILSTSIWYPEFLNLFWKHRQGIKGCEFCAGEGREQQPEEGWRGVVRVMAIESYCWDAEWWALSPSFSGQLADNDSGSLPCFLVHILLFMFHSLLADSC